MNKTYKRFQAALNIETDKDLIEHFQLIHAEFATLKSQSDVLRHILERDMWVSKVYGIAWDWRVVARTPAWMEKLLEAVKNFDGRAQIVIEDKEDSTSQVTIGEGIFDE